jgi:hypothetical protein
VPARLENVADRGREIIQAGTRHDDCVPAAVSFLGDAQEFSALIFAKFEMKSLSFDLNFPRFENAVHLKAGLVYQTHLRNWKQNLRESAPQAL